MVYIQKKVEKQIVEAYCDGRQFDYYHYGGVKHHNARDNMTFIGKA